MYGVDEGFYLSEEGSIKYMKSALAKPLVESRAVGLFATF